MEVTRQSWDLSSEDTHSPPCASLERMGHPSPSLHAVAQQLAAGLALSSRWEKVRPRHPFQMKSSENQTCLRPWDGTPANPAGIKGCLRGALCHQHWCLLVWDYNLWTSVLSCSPHHPSSSASRPGAGTQLFKTEWWSFFFLLSLHLSPSFSVSLNFLFLFCVSCRFVK